MVKLNLTQHVSVPPERAFAVFTDLHRAAERIKGIEVMEILTDGPIGVGTRFEETRVMFKKEAKEQMEITAYEPPHSYTVCAASHGSEYKSVFRFTPDDAGTNVTWEFEGTPISLMAKIMTPLFIMMKGTMVKCMQADLSDLRDAAEQETSPAE